MLELQPFLSHSVKHIRRTIPSEVLVTRGHYIPKCPPSCILLLWQENHHLFHPASSERSLHQSANESRECRASEGLS